LNVPALVLVKATAPLGVVAPPLAMSVTVAVQVVDRPSWKELGSQRTLVLVDRTVAVTIVVPLLLA
jgi:hypothetical protein